MSGGWGEQLVANPREEPQPPQPNPAGAGPLATYRGSRSIDRRRGGWRPGGLATVPAGGGARRARGRLHPRPPPAPSASRGERGRKVRSHFPRGTGKVPEAPRSAPLRPPRAAIFGDFGHIPRGRWGSREGQSLALGAPAV